MRALKIFYPCKCGNTENSCRCEHKLSIEGSHLPFHAKLKNAAKYWSQNTKSHWASRWDINRVRCLIKSVCGDKSPGSVQIRGSHLLRIAIAYQLAEPDAEDSVGELQHLVPCPIHRKKLTRILLQSSPPEELASGFETPRSASPRASQELPAAAQGGASTLSSVVKVDERAPCTPILSVEGPEYLTGCQQHRLDIAIATEAFLQAQVRQQRNEIPLVPHEWSSVARGTELTIVPRIRNVVANPPRQHITWRRLRHDASFSIEMEDRKRHVKDGSETTGHVEVWIGPVLACRVQVSMTYYDTRHQAIMPGAPSETTSIPTWKKLRPFFERIYMVYGRNSEISQSISKVQPLIQSCTQLVPVDSAPGENLFLEKNGDFRENKCSIQLCLEPMILEDPDFLSTCKVLHRCLQLANQGGSSFFVPGMVGFYWKHPRPNTSTHPILSRLPLGDFLFFNEWITKSPHTLTQGASGDSSFESPRDRALFAKNAAVVFPHPKSKQWVRGTIVSQDETQVRVVANGTSEVFGHIPVHLVKPLSSVDSYHYSIKAQTRDSRASKKWRIGDEVFARKSNGKRYLAGVVASVYPKTLDIAFENGEAESHVSLDRVRTRAATTEPSRTFAKIDQEPGKAESGLFRSESSGVLALGTAVYVATGRDGARFPGRIASCHDYGLTYDVMLNNGDSLCKVAVRDVVVKDTVAHHESTQKVRGCTTRSDRSYVDAMCDRFRESLQRAAEESRGGLRMHFNGMDLDRNGVLDAEEMEKCLVNLGFRPRTTEVLEFVDRIGRGGTNIAFSDFLRAALPKEIEGAEKQLKKSLELYEGSLDSIGITEKLRSAFKGRIGLLWQHFVDLDRSMVGYVETNKLKAAFAMLGVSLSSEQVQSLAKSFPGHSGAHRASTDHFDYREFALVAELLVLRSQSPPKRADETQKAKEGHKLSKRAERLQLEAKAALRIQSLFRRRTATKLVAIKRHERLRKQQEGLLLSRTSEDRADLVRWVRNGSNTKSGNDVPGAEALEEGTAVALEQWRHLLRMNAETAGVVPLFKELDADGDGFVTYGDLTHALSRHGFEGFLSGFLLREMDIDSNGMIDMNDLKLFMSENVVKQTKLSGNKWLLMDSLGGDLCEKLRRYYCVLEHCNPGSVRKLLLFRHPYVTITSVLKRQGFTLHSADWKKFETTIETFTNKFGDRNVCDDLMSIVGSTPETIKRERSEYYSNLGESDPKSTSPHAPAAQNDQRLKSALPGLERLRYRIEQAIKELCQEADMGTTGSFSTATSLWWVHGATEQTGDLSMDRLDLEVSLRSLSISEVGLESRLAFEALDFENKGRVPCCNMVDAFGLNLNLLRKFDKILQQRQTRFSKRRCLLHRAALHQGQQKELRLEEQSVHSQMRCQGVTSFSRYIKNSLGERGYKQLRAAIASCKYKGFPVSSVAWLAERANAKQGFASERSARQALDEIGFMLSRRNLDKLFALTRGSNASPIDIVQFCDIVSVVDLQNVDDIGEKPSGRWSGDAVAVTIQKRLQRYIRDNPNQGHKNIVRVFRSIDAQLDGTISKQEFEQVLKRLGLHFESSEYASFFEKHDANKDGKLNYCEFLNSIGVRVFKGPSGKGSDQSSNFANASQPHLGSEEGLRRLVVEKLAKANLCLEDVDDAFGPVPDGFLSTHDFKGIFKALGLKFLDKELSVFLQVTKEQLQRLLSTSIICQDKTSQKKGAAVDYSKGSLLFEQAKSLKASGTISIGTAVVDIQNREKGIVLKLRGADTIEVRLDSGKIRTLSRAQVRVQTAQPILKKNLVVQNRHTHQKGVIVRVYDRDATVFDVKLNNELRRTCLLADYVFDTSQQRHFKRGSRVECLLGLDRMFYPATIQGISPSGLCSVTFDHGEHQAGVPMFCLRKVSS